MTPREWLFRHAAAAADLLFPPQCVCCRRETPGAGAQQAICTACRSAAADEPNIPCPRCAAPLPKLITAVDRCPRCRDEKYAFASVTALGVYQGLLREMVLRMKQPHEEALTKVVGEMLAERLKQDPSRLPDLAAPIPMQWSRRLLRGVNGPELLAETMARRLRIPCYPDILTFRRSPYPQHTLSPAERRLNMRGAFAVKKRYDISGACVLVVDDVLTTGATAHAAATALNQSGAEATIIAVAARGVGV